MAQQLSSSTSRCDQASQSAFALRARAEARISLLNILLRDSQLNEKRDGVEKGHLELSERCLEAILAIDESCQVVSDEKMLATFSNASSHELRAAAEAMKITAWNGTDSNKLLNDPREADYALALSGYSLGSAYALEEHSPEKLLTWIRMLQVAGSEHSVSNRISNNPPAINLTL